MKNYFIIPIIAFVTFSVSFSKGNKIYEIEKAIESGKITTVINGFSGSPHYSQPAKILITNNTSEQIGIRIRNGQNLISYPSNVQDLIVVKNELIILKANEKKEITLNAMCTQRQNSGPNKTSVYKLGEIAKGPMKALTTEIEKRKDYNTLGQYSVWAISNGRNLGTIAGYDEETASHYQTFLSDLTGKPIPERDINDYMTNYNAPLIMKRTIGGSFEYGLSKESAVTIGLFDTNSIIVRELLNKPKTPKGNHSMNFEFDATAFNDDTYYVRLIIDGRIKLGYTMEMME